MFGRRKTVLPITTASTLPRSYEELGLTYSRPNSPFYKLALKDLEKKTQKLYPDADAVIGVTMQSMLLGMRLVGTAVRYKE